MEKKYNLCSFGAGFSPVPHPPVAGCVVSARPAWKADPAMIFYWCSAETAAQCSFLFPANRSPKRFPEKNSKQSYCPNGTFRKLLAVSYENVILIELFLHTNKGPLDTVGHQEHQQDRHTGGAVVVALKTVGDDIAYHRRPLLR